MEELLRFGIVGCGSVAAFHAQAIENTPGAVLTACCSGNPQKARTFAAAHGARAFDTLEELLAGPVDAVCLCTPSGLHARQALEAMAAGAGEFGGIVCPIQDARAGQVYGAAFVVENGRPERLLPDAPMKLDEFVQAISAIGDRFLFLGDGMPVHRARLTELLGDAAVFAPAHTAFLRPGAVAYLASQAEETCDYLTLMPMYLRAPNAERNRRLMEAQHAE